MSSFYALGHTGLEDETLKHAIDLAEEGRVAHAVVMWKKHLDVRDECLCDDTAYDAVRCGFCFAVKLGALDLFEGHISRPATYADTALKVRGFAARKKAAQPIQV